MNKIECVALTRRIQQEKGMQKKQRDGEAEADEFNI
jgi:hypothetical protein